MYSLGDGAKNAKASIFHIEGDPDHPVNRGALCPKGAGLVDFIHSESRLKFRNTARQAPINGSKSAGMRRLTASLS
jgi:anaerobic selenocysteine-containing dehydrogenase